VEKGLSVYWMTLRKRDDTVSWKRKHYIVVLRTDMGRSYGPG